MVPNLLDIPLGCPYHPRCDFCEDRCKKELPDLYEAEKGHLIRCHPKRSK